LGEKRVIYVINLSTLEKRSIS